MKFLVVSRQREVPPLPPEQQVKVVIDSLQMIRQYVKEGKAEVAYGFAGLSGGMGVFSAGSGAELNGLLMRLPQHPFVDHEIYPLMSMEEAVAAVKQSLEAIKARK